MSVLELATILSTAAIVYVYIGYPILIWMIGVVRPKPVAKTEHHPAVSIIIAAHNEAAVIERTIQNKMELDYPKENVEIIVVSDASTDGTDEIVKGFADGGVRLIRQEPHLGKTSALNRAAAQAGGEIIVFSDANSIYAKNALRELVSNFADPHVGYVTGQMQYLVADGSSAGIGKGSSGYMKYENRLRELESTVGSIVGVDGGIDAVRKALCAPMDPSLLPDLVLPLEVIEQGYRVVYEPAAILNEMALEEAGEEYRMRVRVALRAFHALWHKKALFNPFRHGLFSLQLFSHKLLRYLVGFLMVIIFICSIAVQKPWSLAFAGVQAFGYTLALIGHWQNRKPGAGRVFRYPFYFCLINVASAVAFLKFLAGEKQVVWTPRGGEEARWTSLRSDGEYNAGKTGTAQSFTNSLGYGCFKYDLGRYLALMPRRSVWDVCRLWAYTPGLWILFSYRVGRSISHSCTKYRFLKPLEIVYGFFYFLLRLLVGIDLPLDARIGEGLYIGHFGGITIHPSTVMGRNCNLSQGVTIGDGGRTGRRGVPVIGDRVYIGPGAISFGPITIGNDVSIGANAVVNSDVPDGMAVGGIPARVLNAEGSRDFVVVEQRQDL